MIFDRQLIYELTKDDINLIKEIVIFLIIILQESNPQ